MANNLKLQLEIAASGAGATVGELLGVRKAIEQTAAQSEGITQLARAMGTNYDAAKKFADGLKLTPEAALRGVSALRELNAVGASSEVKFATLTAQMGTTVRQYQALDREARKGGQGQVEGASLAGQGLAALAFKYNNVVAAIQSLVATAKPAYDLLIGSNEKLNAQILASQTNLASTSKLSVGGTEITDPTAKIQASRSALQSAIKQIEKDTESLVGVTSSQVNELFQITLQNAAALNNQSKAFPDAISAATSLTKGWAAALNVAGVPLNQARQEINSILKGQVDQNSVLAKSLNITNDQVRQWQAQGRLVDELNKKLEPYVAGNALAARSISGIGSNIQDIIERLGRTTGEPLLEPIIVALDEVYKYLKANEAAITQFFGQLTDEVLRSGKTIADAFAPVGKTLLEIGADIGPIALSAIKGLLQVFVALAKVTAPLVGVLGQAIKVLADFAATDLGGVVVQTATVVIALTQLTTIIGAFAATALPALWAGVLSTVTSLGTLYASVVAVATGNTALAVSIPVLQNAFRLLTAEAIALNTALIPLTAAIGLTVLVRTTNNLADANEALKAYGEQIVSTAGAVGNISVELNQFNKIREAGGVLSEEQVKREKQLRAAALAQAEGIEVQIKAQKELTNLNAAQAAQRDGYIKQLEALRKKLDVSTGGLAIQAKELEKLGTSYEQLSKKAEAANRNIATGGGGDPEVFKKSVAELTKTVEQQAKLRQVNLASAAQTLEQIRADVRVEVDIQQQAKETIVKIYSERVGAIKEQLANGVKDQRESLAELTEIRDRAEVKDDPNATAEIRKKAAQQIVAIRKEQNTAELAEIDANKTKVEALQASQRLGEAEGDRELTALKAQELAKRLEQNQVAAENSTSPVERQQLLAEREKFNADLEKLDADYQKRVKQRVLTDYDEQLSELEAFNAQRLISEADYQSAKVAIQSGRADKEIEQLTEQLNKLSDADTEGREVISAQIAKLQVQKIKILEAGYEAELVLIKDAQAKALDLVVKFETE